MGQRAALLDDVTRILSWLQQHQQIYAPAYLLENVAMQHNFRHAHVRFEVCMFGSKASVVFLYIISSKGKVRQLLPCCGAHFALISHLLLRL